MSPKYLLKKSKECALEILKKNPDAKIFTQYCKDRNNKPGLTPKQINNSTSPLKLYIPKDMIVLDLDLKSENHKAGITKNKMIKFIAEHKLEDNPAKQVTKTGGIHFFYKVPKDFTQKSSGIPGVDLKCEKNLISLYDPTLFSDRFDNLPVFPKSLVDLIDKTKQKNQSVKQSSNDILNKGFNQFKILQTPEQRDELSKIIFKEWREYKEKHGAKTTDRQAIAKIQKSRREAEAQNPYVINSVQNQLQNATNSMENVQTSPSQLIDHVKQHGIIGYINSDSGFTTLDNMFKALNITYRYNTLSEDVELNFSGYKKMNLANKEYLDSTFPLDNEWKQLNDFLAEVVRKIFQKHFKTPPKKKYEKVPQVTPRITKNDLLSYSVGVANTENTIYNPFLKWLEKVYEKHKNSILTPEIAENKILESINTIFTWENPRMAQLAMGYTLCGCIKRQYKPGAQHDIVTILCGPGGVGKTSFWRRLFESESYLASNINIYDDSKKEILEGVMGCVMCEYSEFTANKDDKIDKLKSFITNTLDRVRHAFMRKTTVKRRQFVIVGTTNDKKCLKDDNALLRRFCILSCDKIGDDLFKSGERVNNEMEKGLREVLWASAYVLYKTGWLNKVRKEFETLVQQNSVQHVGGNEEAIDIINEYIQEKKNADPVDQPTTINLSDAIKKLSKIWSLTYYQKKNIVRVLLKENGFKNMRNKKRRVWTYFPKPENIPPPF